MSRAALIVAHPGHELRLHHWRELVHPTVFVITDGSGGTGRSRVASTLDLLERTGARPGSVMGAITDDEVYRAMRECDVEKIGALTLKIAEELTGYDALVADAWEGYNPTHDVCRFIADLVVAHGGIRTYSYTVVDAATTHGIEGEISVPVDDAALARKLASAHTYEELRSEAETLISEHGRESLRAEVLTPWKPMTWPPVMRQKPQYERHGEERVKAGRYASVLRYEEHVAPFLRALAERVQTIAETRS